MLKPTRRSLGSRAVRAMLIALAAILAGLVVAYPTADLLRDRLDDKARTALQHAGKAGRFVRLKSGVMHVRISGRENGPVVLLIHGGAIGGYAYRHWQKPLSDAGYRVIIPDLLGYGFSDRPDVPYTKRFYTTQLGELLDGLGIEAPVHIVGASMGGAIATAFAVQAPGRVASVTLVAPAGGGRNPVVSDALLLPVFGDWVFRVVGASSVRRMMETAYPSSAGRDELVAWMRDQGRYRGFGDGMLNTLRHYDVLWQPEDYAALGKSGLPVLAMWGTADSVNPFSQSKELAARVPQLRLVPLRGKPHAITFGDAASVLAVVLPFLKQADAAAPAPALPR